jgi:hypothetical protein
MAGNKQTKIEKKPAIYDDTGDRLHKLFQSSGTACSKAANEVQRSFSSTDDSQNINNCFKELHHHCPSFSIKYGAAVTRINRNHHGPLKPATQTKPSPRPSCHMLFNSLVANQSQICGDMQNGQATLLADDESSLQVDGSGAASDSGSQSATDSSFIVGQDSSGAKFVIPAGGSLLVKESNPETSVVEFNGTNYTLPTRQLERNLRNQTITLQEGGEPLAQPTPLSTGDLKIISRNTWDPGFQPRGSMSPMGEPVHVTLHYSAGHFKASDQADLSSVKNTHLNSNKWADIGYHFIIPRDGVDNGSQQGDVFEGRSLRYTGAHAGAGNNAKNIGIVLLGKN